MSNDTPVTGVLTLIVQVAEKEPSSVVAVIIVSPLLFAVTRPVGETLATAGTLLSQVTVLL